MPGVRASEDTLPMAMEIKGCTKMFVRSMPVLHSLKHFQQQSALCFGNFVHEGASRSKGFLLLPNLPLRTLVNSEKVPCKPA
jgi:hypothetical protein